MLPTADECAHELIEVIPEVMQTIRSHVRRQRSSDLSVLQLRVLAFLQRNPGAPLSAVAEHVGLTLPSMSTQVTGLVGRKLLNRATSRTDRRYITLTLTSSGATLLAAAQAGAQEDLAQTLATLTEAERTVVMQALQLLRTVFTPSIINRETKDNRHE
jgi:DNA-binding MarR family transcriptional regulator